MEIAIAILNFNGRNYLETFLPSVIAYSDNATIYVIDNCSQDDSVQFLEANYPQINLVLNDENGGFAKGYNQGLQHIVADYYILLNSDIEVTPNWITPCIDFLEKDQSIAALQPKILSHANKNLFEHAGAAGGFLDCNYFPFCRGRIFEILEKDDGQYNDSKEVFWATGACLFIRAELYHELGGLDEDFFAHMEEIDLCWRLKSQGYKIYYCPESVVYHVGGGTLNYKHPKKTYLNFRNSLYMIFKNHEGSIGTKILWRMFLDGTAAGMFLTKFQFKHFWAVLRAHLSMYRNLKSLRTKRHQINLLRSQSQLSGLYKKSITYKKFISGINHFSDLNPNDFT